MPLRAGAALDDRAHVLDLLARPELVDDVVDELEQLLEEIGIRDFALRAEIDEKSANAPPRRAAARRRRGASARRCASSRI